MVEHHEALIESDVAIGQLEIVDGRAGQSRLDEILQVVAPITKTTSQREWQINFVEQLVAGHEGLQQAPGIAELDLAAIGFGKQFAAGPQRSKPEERIGGDERVAGAVVLEQAGTQKNQAGPHREFFTKRLGSNSGGNLMDE